MPVTSATAFAIAGATAGFASSPNERAPNGPGPGSLSTSTIDMDLEELLETLRRIKKEHAGEAEYRDWRKGFPKSWPM